MKFDIFNVPLANISVEQQAISVKPECYAVGQDGNDDGQVKYLMRNNKDTESTERIHGSKNKERPSGGKPKNVILIKLFGKDAESLEHIQGRTKESTINDTKITVRQMNLNIYDFIFNTNIWCQENLVSSKNTYIIHFTALLLTSSKIKGSTSSTAFPYRRLLKVRRL